MKEYGIHAIMGGAEKLYQQPPAPSNELDWSSPVPGPTLAPSIADFNHTRVCSACRIKKQLTAFAVDRSRPLGRTYVCSMCRNSQAKRDYPRKGRVLFPGPPPSPARDGDKKQARQRVNVLVRTGKIPHPNLLPCFDCCHTWQVGAKRHEYDHFLGYGKENHLHVQPVCTNCHRERGLRRGELAK